MCECVSVRVCECASVRVCECASVRVCGRVHDDEIKIVIYFIKLIVFFCKVAKYILKWALCTDGGGDTEGIFSLKIAVSVLEHVFKNEWVGGGGGAVHPYKHICSSICCLRCYTHINDVFMFS